MTDKKQSAVARRLADKYGTNAQDSATNNDNTLKNTIATVSSTVDIINTILPTTTNQAQDATRILGGNLDPDNPGGWEARILELENNPQGGGGGGIDPSDPTQPIIIVDNFIRQPNGNPDGTGGLSFFPAGNTTVLNSNNLPILFTESEIDHNGIIIVRLSASDENINSFILGQTSTADVCRFTDVNTLYYIIKTPATLNHSIRIGFMDAFNSTPSPNEICFERLTTESNISIVTRQNGTQTKTSSGITYSANTWYTFKITRTLANTVDFTINTTTVNQTTNIPIGFLNVGVQIQGNGSNADDEDFKFDFFSLKLGDVAAVLPIGTTVVGTANEVEVTTVGSVVTVGLPSSIIVDQATVDQLNFDTTLTPVNPLGDGVIAYDLEYQSLIMGLDGGPNTNISTPLNSSLVKLVRNETNATITKGQVVYINGSHGSTHIKVSLASALSEATAKDTIGVAAHDIEKNSEGWIITQGYLKGLNTNSTPGTGSEGSTIWLSTTAGSFTYDRPLAPNHGVVVGFMVKSAGNGAGSIYVKITNGQELEELHDVSITNIANNHILQWDSTDARWENRSLSSAGISATGHTHTIADITSIPQTRLLGRWAAGGTGVGQHITIGGGLKLSTLGELSSIVTSPVPDTTVLSAGVGLIGGGDLSSNRTFAVDFATSGVSNETQAVRADDSRLSDARSPLAHTHSLSNLEDFQVTSPQVGQLFRFSGIKWINQAPETLTDGGNF